MAGEDVSEERWKFHLLMIALAALVIGAMFFSLIRPYLMSLFMAAIVSALAAPIYRKVYSLTGDRTGLSVAITLVLLSVGVLLPLSAVFVLGVQQASAVAGNVSAWIDKIDLTAMQASVPDWLPFQVDLVELGATVAARVAEAAGQIANFFVGILSQATKGTAVFFLNLFILVYAMVFFLPQKRNMLQQLLAHSGLPATVQEALAQRAVSISRATIKGTVVIGIVQGILGGGGFWLFGLPGGAFWGCVMAVLSVIPGVGPPLVLIPGIVVLFAAGEAANAVGLAVWTAVVVTTVDNFLRPVLVGRDTKMPDLLVLISTFGGLAAFGAAGLVVGPVIAGLFVTIWGALEEQLEANGLHERQSPGPENDTPEPAGPDDAPNEISRLQAELEELKRQS